MAFGPTVGLDIGTQQIKVVEVKPSKAGLTITALGVAQTPPGVMQNNIVTDPRLMGQIVKQLLKESGVTVKRVVGSVGGQSAVVIRIIEVPKMTDAELKETMKWEVERHVPFASNETVIDYQPLEINDPQAENNPNMEVLLAVAQQDIVNNFVETLQIAGLDPVAIDIEPLATSRALLDIVGGRAVARQSKSTAANTDSVFDTTHHETVAIVNIGAANTDISIYQDAQLMFPRSLPLAGDSLTRAVAETMSYSMDQAERTKREHAVVQLDRMAIYTGTAYGDDMGFEGLQFRDDDTPFAGTTSSGRLIGSGRIGGDEPFVSATTSSLIGGDALVNPFDYSPDGDDDTGSTLNLAKPDHDEIEKTQPISRRTLNLARKPDIDGPPPFIAPESQFGAPAADPGNEALRNQVFEAIAPVLGELATELRRSLDYYRSRAMGRSVDRVLLTGGTANIVDIAAFLQNELQVPVAVADPLANFNVTTKNYDPNYLHTIASCFTVAIGLAVRDAVFDANPAPKKAKMPKKGKGAVTYPPNATTPPVS